LDTPWLAYATCTWTAIFAAPHIWWALGSPFGFPGGEASYRIFMSATWRIVYDWVVVLLSFMGFGVALALVRSWGHAIPQRLLHTLAWLGFGVLTLRGVAGLAVDGLADPVWSPGFLVGGLLFGGLAWRAHVTKVRSGTPRAKA
jgi:hypothetical protein